MVEEGTSFSTRAFPPYVQYLSVPMVLTLNLLGQEQEKIKAEREKQLEKQERRRRALEKREAQDGGGNVGISGSSPLASMTIHLARY